MFIWCGVTSALLRALVCQSPFTTALRGLRGSGRVMNDGVSLVVIGVIPVDVIVVKVLQLGA